MGRAFTKHLPRRLTAPSRTAAADALEAAYDAGRRAHPRVRLDEAAFALHVTSVTDLADPQELAALRGADLYLVAACLQGDAVAHTILEKSYLARLDRVFGAARLNRVEADEVRQWLRELLLFPGERKSPLRTYSGKGDLWHWLCVLAGRAARRYAKRRPRQDAVTSQYPQAADSGLESAIIKQDLADEITRAVEAAIRDVAPEERALLKHHFVDGLGIDALARLYKIHRITVWRRVTRARARVMQEIKPRLKAQLALSTGGFRRLVAAVMSRVRLDLGTSLGEP